MTKKNDKKKGFKPYSKKLSSDQDDSDSVDSRGNIRNLIDYGSTDEMFSEDSNNSNYSATDKVETDYNSKKYQGTTNKLINKLQKEKERLIQQLKYKDDDKKKVYKTRSTKKNNSEDVIMDKNDSDDEDYDDEEYDDEDYDDEEDDEDYDEEEDKEDGNHPKAFTFSFGGMDESEKSVPKRHDMKKETADVKEFVKLITTPSDEDTIDGQIDQFKALSEDKKTKLLNVLGNRNKASGTSNPQQGLMFKILTMDLPPETQSMVMSKYNSLQNLDPGSSEYFKLRNWLEKLTSIPIGIYKELPVTINNGVELCRTFMENARKCLDNAIYGQDEAKLQILQFIGTKIANPTGRGLSLLLSGPPGIGKTSLIKYGVAKALEWPFQFISLGGDSDASTYTGHQLVYESSHCGKIVNSLCSAKSMSMVLMFDELDKISTTPKGEEVQNLLVHLTDPVQNGEFEDKYLSGVNIDLSRIMFTFSANDLNKIDRVLLDRMIVVQLQGYNQKEKVAIAENYLLPAALKDVGLTEKVAVSKEVLEYVLSEYASEETGVRELKRCMEQITQKVNMLRMFNSKELPFYIKDFTLPFVVKKEHVDLFLKKRSASIDISAKMMYI
jgi:ATP-dependent Lon protease